ncbi:MAG: RluA family pseudouridine synthase [Lachnospiraceae bacterium]|nr:RluA family pseudouridine synthase [Lachnospiraceae bacterium]
MEEFKFEVMEKDGGERIDKFITDCIPALTRSYIRKMIDQERCFVNGKAVKASYRIKEEDVVAFSLPENMEPDIEAEDIPLPILYEDADVLIVDKPKHMVVHPAPGHYSGTLVNAVMYHCKDSLSGINGVMRPGIVHRIDKDTSGSLIICKNDMAHNSIAAQLKEHTVNRIYHAIVYGVLNEDEMTIDAPLGRDPKDRLKIAVVPNGKRAVTHVRVLKRYQKFTYIACRLETGRTHQIRVHMAHIGHPILGDEVYAPRRKRPVRCEGQTLHAKVIGFMHPANGEYMEFDAPLPEYFRHLLEILP